MRVAAFCDNFELHGLVTSELEAIVRDFPRMTFEYQVSSSGANSGQLTSNFDGVLQHTFQQAGAGSAQVQIPKKVRQKLDFAFKWCEKVYAVEVEKSNREKILRDILKAHMYLSFGADAALIVLPRNYPHSGGICFVLEENATTNVSSSDLVAVRRSRKSLFLGSTNLTQLPAN